MIGLKDFCWTASFTIILILVFKNVVISILQKVWDNSRLLLFCDGGRGVYPLCSADATTNLVAASELYHIYTVAGSLLWMNCCRFVV